MNHDSQAKSSRWPLVFAPVAGLLAVCWWLAGPQPAVVTSGPADAAVAMREQVVVDDTPRSVPANNDRTNRPQLPVPPRRSIADLFESAGDLSDDAVRQRVIAEMRTLEDGRRTIAARRATDAGLPTRLERPDGTVKEIVDWDEVGPVYFITHNANAAISTGANLLQQTPYGLDGADIVIGMWDGGAGRPTHREFQTGRMVVMDGAAPIDHATHVGGTLAAVGITASARGMAPAATVDSYDWNNDKSEMTSRGAASPGQAGRIYLSNHSYGYISGWYRTGGSSPAYIWYGSGTTASSVDPRFGQYNSFASDSDTLAFNAPYYLMFRSAGNDRIDNPSAGQTIQLSPSNTATTTYDPAVHPAGDGIYRGGYDTISFDSVAKNVITIGSVADAVTSGQRDISKAGMASYSSWGPTDDGRIKPDLVANGESVYSARNGGDSSYATYSGTSMATPNAAGTAALLISEYARLFSGGAMRSSTLKGLLIHTADDLGTPGPDYRFGWGLVNGMAAADLLRDHAANPAKIRLTENLMTSSAGTVNHEFLWDGVSPIRVTLCWTDPAGSSTTSNDLRTPRLRNNLDVRVIAPDGTPHLPYVMPFVGTWTQESMTQAATTGINNTDNVEQVYIAAPQAAGVYRAVVSFQGTLANNQQHYSLFVSGASADEPPPPPLALSDVSPATGLTGGPVQLVLEGFALASATDVRLTRPGEPDIIASALEMLGDSLHCQIDLTAAAAGVRDVTVTSASETSTLAEAFTVVDAIFSETFDGPVTGWAGTSLVGSNSWSLATDFAHTPERSYFIAAPASRTSTALASPAIPIPGNADDMQLRFWHRFDTQRDQDGGRIEFSVDGGAWFGVDATDSGLSFASNGYNSEIAATGPPNSRSPFAGEAAWSGNSGGFIETIINFTDTAKFAGNSLRVRWVFATNATTASFGWHVDTIAIIGGGDATNQPPAITSGPTTDATETISETVDEVTTVYHLVTAASIGVAVSATDDGGPENLTFTWTAVSGPGPVGFLPNGTSAATTSEAFFEETGDYRLDVTVSDAGGLSTTGSVWVRVTAVADSVAVAPSGATVMFGESRAFSAQVLDQFGDPMAEQPASFTWTTTGGGVVDDAGLFTATEAGENFTLIAEAPGGQAGFAQLTVTPAPASVTIDGLEREFDGTPKPVAITTDPPGLAVAVSYDGADDAPTDPGSYLVDAAVIDPNHQGTASATLVINLAPYDAWALDQFTEDQQLAGLAAPDADPDGDGLPNRFEFLLGFDPNDSESRLRTSMAFDPSGNLSFTVNRIVPGIDFIIEGSATLDSDDWQEILRIHADEGESHVDNVEIPLPGDDTRRFYRLRLIAMAE